MEIYDWYATNWKHEIHYSPLNQIQNIWPQSLVLECSRETWTCDLSKQSRLKTSLSPPEPAWARLSLARPTRPARRARRTRVRRPELSLIGRLARTAARPKLKKGACSRLVPKVPHPLTTTRLAHSTTSGLFSWTCHSESVEASSVNRMQVWASLTKRITVCR